ncbi:MAG: hypothetical protein R3F43_28440 [bacterium]
MQAALPDRSQLTVNSPRANAASQSRSRSPTTTASSRCQAGSSTTSRRRPDFAVAGVAPAAGPVAGGNDVFIAGSGFTAATGVAFDGRAVPCNASTACTAPPRRRLRGSGEWT